MKNANEVIRYFRKNRSEEAVIYVRGNNEKMQEIVCRLYASEKGYKITYVTSNLEDVNLCDILLITNPSRISRDSKQYYKTVKKLKERGIEVVSVASQDNADECIDLAIDLFR